MAIWLIALIIGIVVAIVVIVVVVAVVVPVTIVLIANANKEAEICPDCPGTVSAYYIGATSFKTDIDTLDNLAISLGNTFELGNDGNPIFYACDTSFPDSVEYFKQTLDCSLPTEQINITDDIPIMMEPLSLETNTVQGFSKKRKAKSIISDSPQKQNIFKSFTPCELKSVGHIFFSQGNLNSSIAQECCRLTPQIRMTVNGPESQQYTFPQVNGNLNYTFGPNNTESFFKLEDSANPDCFNVSSFPPPPV